MREQDGFISRHGEAPLMITLPMSTDVMDCNFLPPGVGAVRKNVHFVMQVSDRAQKHVQALIELATMGHRVRPPRHACQSCEISFQDIGGLQAACMFIVQRSDCDAFAPCHAKDPEYGRLVQTAAEKGVIMIAVSVELKPDGTVNFLRELPIHLEWTEDVSEPS